MVIAPCVKSVYANQPAALLQLLEADTKRGEDWQGNGFSIVGLLAMARPNCGK
jgi:hypothetical protein